MKRSSRTRPEGLQSGQPGQHPRPDRQALSRTGVAALLAGLALAVPSIADREHEGPATVPGPGMSAWAPLSASTVPAVLRAGNPLAGYHDPEAAAAKLRDFARKHPDRCSLSTYGKSRGGRDLHVLTIADEGSVPADQRTALLIVGNVDGDHLIGTETALAVASRLLGSLDTSEARDGSEGDDMAALRDFLTSHAVHIIPVANPDVADRAFDTVQDDHRRGGGRDDADRDGFFDEDPPNDLNDDGLITWMRVYDPDKADMMADPAEPRLNIRADRDKGQRPEFTVMIEGIDDDGDGDVNEDGRGGVELNRNFPQGWEQYRDESGAFPVSEPESKALIDFMLARPQIAVVINYGRPDSLSTPPKGTGRDVVGKPIDIETEDAGIYAFLGERYRDLAGTKEPEGASDWKGTFPAWAYGQYGVWTFSTTLWSKPAESDEKKKTDEDAAEASEAKSSNSSDDNASTESDGDEAATPVLTSMSEVSDETIDELHAAAVENGYQVTREQVASLSLADFEMYAQAAGITIKLKTTAPTEDAAGDVATPTGTRKGKPQNAAEAGWLAYSDDVRDGAGFVEWTEFDHPSLGRVEVGGFAPYFRTNPPVTEVETIADAQVKALAELVGRFASVKIERATARTLADGLHEVEVVLVNDGYLPTAPFIGLRTREGRPFVVRLENVSTESLMSGNKVEFVWRIAGSGGRESLRWLVRTGSGDEALDAINVTVFNERHGTSSTTIGLPK